MPAVSELLELQSVDVDLGGRRSTLAQIEPLLGDDKALRKLATASRMLDRAAEDAAARQREIEAAVEDYTARVDAAETKLYSGTVKSPRELQDLAADVDMLKRRRSEQEDALLAILDEAAEAVRRRDLVAARLEREAEKWHTGQRRMSDELERIREEVAQLEVRRKELMAIIPMSETVLYAHARRRHPNSPVARLRGSNCEGCRIGVPSSLLMQVRGGGKLAVCPNCDRVLVPE